MTDSRAPAAKLILGVDGGGSKTAARLGTVLPDGSIDTLGEGVGGPGNVRSVGTETALSNLDTTIAMAFSSSGLERKKVDCAVLALAGSSLADVRSSIAAWAERRQLATQFEVVHDLAPVLALGLPEHHGVALIVGTGSVAVALDRNGQRAQTGGWGHWFGDQGSGFDLGRKALTAIAAAVDGLGPETRLQAGVLAQLEATNTREILKILSMTFDTRQQIASLAPLVLNAAREGDCVAVSIVNAAVRASAALVTTAATRLGLKSPLPLALAGSVICSNTLYRESLLDTLRASELVADPVMRVTDPVAGSLIMARNRLLAVAN